MQEYEQEITDREALERFSARGEQPQEDALAVAVGMSTEQQAMPPVRGHDGTGTGFPSTNSVLVTRHGAKQVGRVVGYRSDLESYVLSGVDGALWSAGQGGLRMAGQDELRDFSTTEAEHRYERQKIAARARLDAVELEAIRGGFTAVPEDAETVYEALRVHYKRERQQQATRVQSYAQQLGEQAAPHRSEQRQYAYDTMAAAMQCMHAAAAKELHYEDLAQLCMLARGGSLDD